MKPTIIDYLADLLLKGNAHVSMDEALGNMPIDIVGTRPDHLPYSIWQIAGHIRITQWDILEFSKQPGHVSPQWPQGYWPEEHRPSSVEKWNECVAQIKADRNEFIDLLKNSGDHLFDPFPYGNGQSLFKEALVLADHNSYHTGEIIVLRRLLNAWEN
jgi:DinB superfamily